MIAVVDALLAERATKRQRSFARRSALPANVSLAAVRTHSAGKHALTPSVLGNLATCDWVRLGHSLVVTGPTQSGKSYLATALAQEATLAKLSTRYLRTSHWLAKCEQAASAQAVLDDIRALTKVKLLVLDDFATQVADARRSHWLRELLDARACAGVSTLIAATPPMEEWDERFEDALAADAVVGRVSTTTALNVLETRRSERSPWLPTPRLFVGYLPRCFCTAAAPLPTAFTAARNCASVHPNFLHQYSTSHLSVRLIFDASCGRRLLKSSDMT